MKKITLLILFTFLINYNSFAQEKRYYSADEACEIIKVMKDIHNKKMLVLAMTTSAISLGTGGFALNELRLYLKKMEIIRAYDISNYLHVSKELPFKAIATGITSALFAVGAVFLWNAILDVEEACSGTMTEYYLNNPQEFLKLDSKTACFYLHQNDKSSHVLRELVIKTSKLLKNTNQDTYNTDEIIQNEFISRNHQKSFLDVPSTYPDTTRDVVFSVESSINIR